MLEINAPKDFLLWYFYMQIQRDNLLNQYEMLRLQYKHEENE
jgi:hypothetical protein